MKVLIDSNVIIAYLDAEHVHHLPSRAVFQSLRDEEILVSAHSLLEAYNKLTRGSTTSAFTPDTVSLTLRSLADRISVRALQLSETLAAMENFARLGGRGARLYDFLIGQVAVLHGAPRIVTWNVRDFTPLFPMLTVVSPDHFPGAS